MLVGDMDNSGSLNAQIIHQLTSQVRSKVAFQVQISKGSAFPSVSRSDSARDGIWGLPPLPSYSPFSRWAFQNTPRSSLLGKD